VAALTSMPLMKIAATKVENERKGVGSHLLSPWMKRRPVASRIAPVIEDAAPALAVR
jgi:hypothetical protein